MTHTQNNNNMNKTEVTMPRSCRCYSNCAQVPKSCRRRRQKSSTTICRSIEYHHYRYYPFLIIISCIVLISSVHNNFVIVVNASSYNNNNNIMNPYTVLGVSNNANNKEIKSKYRELCLKYHPDKYNGLSSKEKVQYENKFKLIQDAYSKIGTITSRKQYDTMSYYTNSGASSNTRSSSTRSSSNRNDNTKNNNNNPFNDYSSTSYDEMLRRMFAEQQQRQQQQQYQQSQHQTQSQFYNSGMNSNSPFASTVANGLSVLSSLKCIYKQRVPITLEELYNGQRHYDIMSNLKSRQQQRSQTAYSNTNSNNNNIQYIMSGLINNFIVNVWKRYTAAFRGGVAYIYLYQAFIYSIPILRISKVLSLLFALYLFDRSIPIMNLFDDSNDIIHDDYYADILPGYKGGTKFTYHDSTNSRIDNGHYGLNTGNPISGSTAVIDLVFELYETKHKLYTRIGNNLHTTITISTKDAYNGCSKQLSSLNYNSIRNDEMITINVPPNTVSGTTITMKGYGWPIRSKATKTTSGSNNALTKYGDLIVTILVPQSFDWKRLLNKLKRQSYH